MFLRTILFAAAIFSTSASALSPVAGFYEGTKQTWWPRNRCLIEIHGDPEWLQLISIRDSGPLHSYVYNIWMQGRPLQQWGKSNHLSTSGSIAFESQNAGGTLIYATHLQGTGDVYSLDLFVDEAGNPLDFTLIHGNSKSLINRIECASLKKR